MRVAFLMTHSCRADREDESAGRTSRPEVAEWKTRSFLAGGLESVNRHTNYLRNGIYCWEEPT